MSMHYLIGIDVGGTFTDIMCLDLASGRLQSAKVPSTPGEQWKGVLKSLAALSIHPASVDGFVHGTTIATNALLEGKGTKTAFVTTAGFRDTLEIGKTRRLVGGLFDMAFQRTKPVIQRRHRYEISERVDGRGAVVREMRRQELEPIAKAALEEGVGAVAVGFVNSYVNDSHEQEAVEYLRSILPADIPVSASTEITRERGEFERFSTVALNAYLAPTVAKYLDTLKSELDTQAIIAPVQIMGSSGGFMTLATARRFPVKTFLSGPVGGVIGAKQVAALSGVENFITFDMGGTSTDVALVAGAMPRVSYSNLIGAYPTQAPQLDIHTIGAGGGSIARRDEDGGLDVGPESAGANPGPSCYMRGGIEPTITDANVVLGRLPIHQRLGGTLKLSREASLKAFERLARSSTLQDIAGLADGILKIAVVKMAGAVREVSVHRGYDPRDFYLVGFGGAGPMHVFLVAEELGVGTVLIPRYPGHLSALGQILADAEVHLVQAFAGDFDTIGDDRIRAAIGELRKEAVRQFQADGIGVDQLLLTARADVRYKGQSFTIGVDIADIDAPDIDLLADRFHAAHQSTFGHSVPDQPIEVVNIRLVGASRRSLPSLVLVNETNVPAQEEFVDTYWEGRWIRTRAIRREALARGARVVGPLIIEEQGGTTVVPPDWSVEVDGHGNLLCRHKSASPGRLR